MLKVPGWKCSLRGGNYFAEIIAACISRSISRMGLRSIFLVYLEPLLGSSQSEVGWHFNNGSLFVSQTKGDLPPSMQLSYRGSRTPLWGLPQQEQSSRELQFFYPWNGRWYDRWACFWTFDRTFLNLAHGVHQWGQPFACAVIVSKTLSSIDELVLI